MCDSSRISGSCHRRTLPCPSFLSHSKSRQQEGKSRRKVTCSSGRDPDVTHGPIRLPSTGQNHCQSLHSGKGAWKMELPAKQLLPGLNQCCDSGCSHLGGQLAGSASAHAVYFQFTFQRSVFTPKCLFHRTQSSWQQTTYLPCCQRKATLDYSVFSRHHAYCSPPTLSHKIDGKTKGKKDLLQIPQRSGAVQVSELPAPGCSSRAHPPTFTEVAKELVLMSTPQAGVPDTSWIKALSKGAFQIGPIKAYRGWVIIHRGSLASPK